MAAQAVAVVSDESFGFAPPPFRPAEALVQLERALRDLRLSERGNGFELKGRSVVALAHTETTIVARLARRLALSPEWDSYTLKSAADQRKLLDEVRKRLQRWQRED
jgi:hypothetical protein